MKKAVDCLLIGYNEMDFVQYEKNLRKTGTNSGAYRDLNLNFIRYDNRPYPAAEILNLFCRDSGSSASTFKPVTIGETFSPAIAYLGTYLNNRGLTFDYVNSFQDHQEELAQKLSKQEILTIAITTTLYVSELPILEIIRFIKTYNLTAKIILGGPFVSTRARVLDTKELEYLFFNTIGADFYINSSQGEATLMELIYTIKKNLPLDRVNNIYYQGDNHQRLITTTTRREDNRLSENMVDWDLFSHHLSKFAALRTSISCPFSCAFCGFPQHAGKHQTLEVEYIQKELNRLQEIGKVKVINFIDDTFNVPTGRYKDILRMMIKNKYGFRWHSYFRPQFADREMVRLMKESGCEGVFLGLESGSDQILGNMNKMANREKYLKGIDLLKEYEIITFGSFIIGFPGETRETVQETLQLIAETRLDFYRCQLWYCEPITPIWKLKEKYKIKGESFEWQHVTMNSKTASDIIDEIFLTNRGPVWIPQYNFDFDGIWHLIHRGMSLKNVKAFLESFNQGIKEKLDAPTAREISFQVIKGLKNSCREISDFNDSFKEKKPALDSYNITFNY